MLADQDARYLPLLVEPIRVCADYKPKFGHGLQGACTLKDFQAMYRKDPFYAWFGLDNPLMYAAHKAAGGMTSIYRQIGIACEHLFRAVLQDQLGLSEEDSQWSYTVTGIDKRTRKLKLDARIPLEVVSDSSKREKVRVWVSEVSAHLKLNPRVAKALKGVVFEVRQGYKSKDSKRQNADIANAATAYTQAYLPCVALLSTQMDSDIVTRYRNERWAILVGRTGDASAIDSTYSFMRDVIGYDLAGFFQRHSEVLRTEVAKVLDKLLRTE